jgi:hypothetical protein
LDLGGALARVLDLGRVCFGLDLGATFVPFRVKVVLGFQKIFVEKSARRSLARSGSGGLGMV